MFVLPGLIGNTQRNCFDAALAGGSPGPFDVSYLTNLVDVGNASTYTFSAVSFGAADAGRKIVVALQTTKVDPAPTVTSVTIGGVTATLVPSTSNALSDSGTSFVTAIYEAAVPTGTSGDIVIVMSLTCVRMNIGVWRVVSGTASAGSATNSTGATALGRTITIPTSGVGIYYIRVASNVSFSPWTNLDVEDFDAVSETTGAHTGGRRTTAGTTAVTANWLVTTACQITACAYGP